MYGNWKKSLDAREARKISRGYDLKVKIRKSPIKGNSLYAKKKIKKGNVIAYYKFLVIPSHKKGKINDGYVMTVYTKGDRVDSKHIGDIFEGSLSEPKYNIPFWAHFSNEPNKGQKPNSYLDINIKGNYRHRNKVKTGDTMIYKLRARRDILPGEEIMWCYGEEYDGGYPTSCSKPN